MAKSDDNKTQADGGSGGGQPPADNAEARIAAQRLEDLSKQAADARAELATVKGDLEAAKGELERAKTEITGLKAQNERLEAATRQLVDSATARDSLPGLPVDLPKGAAQLTESMTIAALGDDGKPVRATVKRGDVVFVGSKSAVADLQAEIGLVARVYAVSKETAEELRALKAIR